MIGTILAKLGMWLHKHDVFWEISCSEDRAVWECQKCGAIWAYDRKVK
jgi:hypothetical protein